MRRWVCLHENSNVLEPHCSSYYGLRCQDSYFSAMFLKWNEYIGAKRMREPRARRDTAVPTTAVNISNKAFLPRPALIPPH